MRSLLMSVLLSFIVACASQASPARTPTSTDSAATTTVPPSSPPEPSLAETPADKLGTAPAGFGLKIGDSAPGAALPDITGKTRSLAEAYRQGPTLVVFYRGGWCPFCNQQIHQLTVAKPDFDIRGIRIVAISVDRPTEEAKTQAQHGVPFLMLSDSRSVAHQAFKVVHVPGDAERSALSDYKIDLGAYSGESHGNFAVPSVFLVDRAGVIRFVHVDQDYMTRPSAKQLLAVADQALGKR